MAARSPAELADIVALLREHLSAGGTRGEFARHHGLTPSTVHGITRRNLPEFHCPPPPPRTSPRRRHRKRPPAPEPLSIAQIQAMQRRDGPPPLFCQWPAGKQGRTWLFCESACEPGQPYCLDHCRISFPRFRDVEAIA